MWKIYQKKEKWRKEWKIKQLKMNKSKRLSKRRTIKSCEWKIKRERTKKMQGKKKERKGKSNKKEK